MVCPELADFIFSNPGLFQTSITFGEAVGKHHGENELLLIQLWFTSVQETVVHNP